MQGNHLAYAATQGINVSLSLLTGVGGGLVCESDTKADLLSDHLTVNSPEIV